MHAGLDVCIPIYESIYMPIYLQYMHTRAPEHCSRERHGNQVATAPSPSAEHVRDHLRLHDGMVLMVSHILCWNHVESFSMQSRGPG